MTRRIGGGDEITFGLIEYENHSRLRGTTCSMRITVHSMHCHRTMAIGLTLPWPAMSGAEP
jgi:hypothetical protein